MGSVLIVDDNPADRVLFRSILGRAGFEVEDAAYGRDVLPRLEQSRPDAVILDVNLPDTDGHSVCREIRRRPEWTTLPVLMLTVRDDDASVLDGLEAGADDYVAKDAPAEVIVSRLRRLVRFRQLARVAALNEGLVQVGKLMAGIVHEIRGPVSVIRGGAEILKMEHPEDLEILERVEPIIGACQLLQVRLEHLMATVRTGPAQRVPIELWPVLEEAAELFRKGTSPRNRRIEIQCAPSEDSPVVLGDAGRLMQVFLNLLSNAHEAVLSEKEQGRIMVRIKQDGRDQEGVTVCVEDDGPGFAPGVAERVFEPFFTTKVNGSGYGLYLAGEIIREHKGRLSASNAEGGGACVSVWLPRGEWPEAAEVGV